MATFVYKAMQNGKLTEGSLDASGRQDALRKLESQGFKPISLAEGKAKAAKGGAAKSEPGVKEPLFASRKVSHKELENFTRQLASLLASGVPLSRALHILGREAATPIARQKWQAIHNQVIDGMALNEAMAQHPETFPRVYIAMVQAGELGGFLDLVLNQITEFQSAERELKSKMTSAMIYPSVLSGLLAAVMVFLMVFFIPKFKTLFDSFDAPLPVLTRAIMATSDFIRDYGLFIALGVGVVVYMASEWLATEQGRRKWHQQVLTLPVVGGINAKFAMTRFCRMLGTLTGSGVALIQALKVARESIGNQTLTDAVGYSIERVRQGEPLAASLKSCTVLFNGSTIEMISLAEESGTLDKELVRLANVTTRELDSQLRNGMALLEPIMLFAIAGVIGTIFMGMVLPIFTIQDYIK